LAGSDIEDLENSSQREIYRRLVFQAGSIRDTHFFHRSALVPDDGGLAWLPHDLYDLPPASSWSETHRVLPSGDVVGFWGVLAPTRSQPKITDFIWGQNHPITALHVKKAMLMSPDDHIILTEKNIREPVRGLYVKVIRKPAVHKDNYASQIICCSLVGQVYFPINSVERAGEIKVCLGELPANDPDVGKGVGSKGCPQETAIAYVSRIWDMGKPTDRDILCLEEARRWRPLYHQFNAEKGSERFVY
jgi:hypothetical protein